MNEEIRIGLAGDMTMKQVKNYEKAIKACGARVVKLENADPETVDSLDGIILMGGGDIDPSFYGKENVSCYHVNPKLDKLEWKLLDEAVEKKIPVFGICRGLQLINVYFGGSLIQHLPCEEKHWGTCDQIHNSKVLEGSFLDRVYKCPYLNINSAHHQGIDELGKGLIPAQYSTSGIIEAVSHESLPVWAVQWHPERTCLDYAQPDLVDGLQLLDYFISSCKKREEEFHHHPQANQAIKPAA